MTYATITTKYLGPGNVRGARIHAKSQAGSKIVGWVYAYNSEQNHVRAAKLLAAHLGWAGVWVGGENPDHTLTFVCLPMNATGTLPVIDPAQTVSFTISESE